MGKRDDNPFEDRAKNKRARATSPVEDRSETASSKTASTPRESSGSIAGTSGTVASTSTKPVVTTTSPKQMLSKTQKPSDSRTTVETIIPHPTTSIIDDAQVMSYGDTLRKRLQELSVYVNEKAEIYTLAKVLPTATWGTYFPGTDLRNVLCNPATNKPVVIWIVGHIVSLWFTRNGIPERQGSITVLPLSTELAKQGVKLLSMFANPCIATSTEDNLNAIRAITWQSTQDNDTPELFTASYDALEAVRNKQAMPGYDVTDLQKDDLVLVECKMTRYRTKDADNKNWSTQTQMELLAISLLHKGVQVDRVHAENDEAAQEYDICI